MRRYLGRRLRLFRVTSLLVFFTSHVPSEARPSLLNLAISHYNSRVQSPSLFSPLFLLLLELLFRPRFATLVNSIIHELRRSSVDMYFATSRSHFSFIRVRFFFRSLFSPPRSRSRATLHRVVTAR